MTLLNGHDSGANAEESLQRVRNLPGYTTPIFNGKDEQRAKVKVDVTAKVLLSVSFEVKPHCALHH
jgi:glutamate dehydrogenase